MATIYFSATVGDDIAVNVLGDYDAPDNSVGYSGSCWINEVRVSDSAINIISLLTDKQIERLEYEGMDAYEQQKLEAAYEAAEMRYQASRDNKGE